MEEEILAADLGVADEDGHVALPDFSNISGVPKATVLVIAPAEVDDVVRVDETLARRQRLLEIRRLNAPFGAQVSRTSLSCKTDPYLRRERGELVDCRVDELVPAANCASYGKRRGRVRRVPGGTCARVLRDGCVRGEDGRRWRWTANP